MPERDFLDIRHRPDLLMPAHQRRKLLKEWASGERKADSDVVARVALDEVEYLEIRILAMEEEVNRLKRKEK